MIFGTNQVLPNFSEAMEGEHPEALKLAIQQEIRALEKHGTWSDILRTTVAEDAENVPPTWA